MRGVWWTVALAICSPGAALADRQFWAVVGSYREFAYAQEALDHASAVLPESFTMTSIDIASGRWQRVLTGPYRSQEAAELVVIEAQQAGFVGAWMLATRSEDIDAPPDYAEVQGYSVDVSQPADGYPDIESLLSPVPSADEREADQARAQREIVSEAPAGYGLHRLRRDDQ